MNDDSPDPEEEVLKKEKQDLLAKNKESSTPTKIDKEIVKADGNCLFNCATLAIQGTVDQPMETRELVASVMLSEPTQFSKDVLGKEPMEYVAWLTGSSSAWGGIPELKALSLFFSVEFAVVVINDLEVLVFG